MGWKRFNDRLAVILAAVIIPGLWVANTWLQMTGEIIGVPTSIAILSLLF